jgi:PhoPQ-activated pathogenicity-related protein
MHLACEIFCEVVMVASRQMIFLIILLPILFSLGSCGNSIGNPENQTLQPKIPALPEQPDSLESNPVARYLAEADPAYHYELAYKTIGIGYAVYVLRMTSQRWLNEALVDEPEWWHWLTIVVPEQVASTTGLLWIGEGTRHDPAPVAGPVLVEAALATGTVVAHLHNIPFQPLAFVDKEEEDRFEDELLAYGWRVFLEGGAKDHDAEWLPQLPMAKGVIRALDTISQFSSNNLELIVDRFVITGASKRGWATWITSIFDDRVIAIIPKVIDLLNIRPSLEHHWRVYGEWTPVLRDYEHEGIMEWQLSEEFERSLELIDPYFYPDQPTMPKFIINAASDEFFLPDSWRFYWNDLPGDKYLRYVPNAGHALNRDAVESVIAFHEHIVTGTALPRFDWEVADGRIVVEIDPHNPPQELRLWQVVNPETRDFRLYELARFERSWTSELLDPAPDGVQEISLTSPEEGYRAWFIEATFTGSSELPLKLSTGVVVTPDTYPFERYEPEQPRGRIIER